MESWHNLTTEEVLTTLNSNIEGLSSSEVLIRKQKYGLNELSEKETISLWKIFFSQFLNPLIFILFSAAIVKYALGSFIDASVIIATILFMVLVAFFQESKAEKAMEALKNLSSPKSKVKRDGYTQLISSKNLVPGDILILEAGDRVSADARVLKAVNLRINESILTGESVPIDKHADIIPKENSLADRNNMLYSGTTVVYGKAVAIVCSIGMETEIGKIANQLKNVKKEKTPLQKSIHRLSNWMLVSIVFAITIFIVIGLIANTSWLELFLLSVAIAVAAIPEGLPAVVTVVLASGVHLMSKKNAIIRKLVAVETLGCTNTICSDKTGTLTLNQMTLVELFTLQEHLTIDYNQQIESGPIHNKDILMLLKIGALCNDASIQIKEDKEQTIGDPTECALIEALKLWNQNKTDLEKHFPREAEIPFSSDKQYMATLNQFEDKSYILIKGAPEKLLDRCNYVFHEGSIKSIDQYKHSIETSLQKMANQGLRVLAAGFKETHNQELNDSSLEENLVFCGFFGIIDPPRKEAIEAVEKCHQAGISVTMITGDNPITAQAIAKQIGLKTDRVVTGNEIEHTQEKELIHILQHTHVFARIEPLHKLKIVNAYKKSGQIVAMTGDGVNDAPALESANIGISMGITGTDVAKEASDMILSDDNFATIVDSVEEGRIIFNRLRHAAAFLLITCFGEVLTILLSFIFTQTTPLEPLQILWINLMTGSIIAIPLGMEPKIGDELRHPPRHHKIGLIFPGMLLRISCFSAIFGIGSFLIFLIAAPRLGILKARTMVFCSVTLFEWLMAMHMRSDELPIQKIGFFKNKMLNIAILIAIILFATILYIPVFQRVFHTIELDIYDWIICILPGFLLFILENFRKQFLPKLFSYGKWIPGKIL